MSWMLGPLREGIMTILIVAGPIILAAAAVGLLIGILQAATQIQDQAIPSALKLIGVLLLLVFMGMWMFSYITNFTEKTIGRAFAMVINNRTPIAYPERKPAVNPSVQTQPSEAGLIRPLEPLSPASNNGPFQATLAPPMQSFNNALQSAAPPANLTVRSAPPSMNLSYAGPSNYQNQTPPAFNQGQSAGYAYPPQGQSSQNYPPPPQAPVNNFNQAGAPPPVNSSPPQPPIKSKSTSLERRSSNTSAPVNRVVLQRNQEADLPGPVQIRPRLPGLSSSEGESASSNNYGNTIGATGDRLEPPGSNKNTSAGTESSTAWW